MALFPILLSLMVAMASGEQQKRPNIVVVLTDDVDTELGTEMAMNKTREWIHSQGVEVGVSAIFGA